MEGRNIAIKGPFFRLHLYPPFIQRSAGMSDDKGTAEPTEHVRATAQSACSFVAKWKLLDSFEGMRDVGRS